MWRVAAPSYAPSVQESCSILCGPCRDQETVYPCFHCHTGVGKAHKILIQFGINYMTYGIRKLLYSQGLSNNSYPELNASCCSWSHALQPKKLYRKLVWWCHQLLCQFLENSHLSRMSRQSRQSANDKGDTVFRFLLAFTLWQRKTSTRRQSDENSAIINHINGVPYLQMKNLSSNFRSL